MAILKIPGKEITDFSNSRSSSSKEKETDNSKPIRLEPLEDDDFELVQAVEVSATRGTEDQLIELNIVEEGDEEEDEIIDVLFDDGIEWIGSSQDFLELFSDEEMQMSRGEEGIIIPSGITDGRKRGLRTFFKSINIFRKKKGVINKTGREIAKWIDGKLAPNPGLKRIDSSFSLIPFEEEEEASKHYFIFIHGTISNTDGSFKKLKEFDTTGAWPAIFDKYQKNVLALEHETVSQSPLYNAHELLKALPDDARINLISGSRGGMVGDIMARCDERNGAPAFDKSEIQTIREWDASEAELMVNINKLARTKKIEVHQNIRVACPAGGTDIIGRRADHFLNGLLGVIGLFVGSRANPIYQIVRQFLTKVVGSRLETGVMPGLLAMVRESKYVQIFNNTFVKTSDNLFIIEGRSRFGKFGHSLLVIFTRLYFRGDNDFVVNTFSMRLGARRRKGFHWMRTDDGQTHHLNYFKNPPSQKAIRELMEAQENSVPDMFRHSSSDSRGVVLKVFNLKEEDNREITGNKPIVILLPGIMGSHLKTKGESIWVDFNSIYKGKIKTHLDISQKDVTAPSIIGNYYSKMVDALKPKYDVYCFPYDWRKSVTEAADKLKDLLLDLQKYNQPIRLLAHSMGGLVVRAMISGHQEVWNKYIKESDSRFIMLGTPWYGSYLIVEVLTGKSSRVNQLAILDFKNSKKALLEIFLKYPGIFELLPIEEKNKFELESHWTKLTKEFPKENFVSVPDKAMLKKFKAIKDSVKSLDKELDFDKIIYVAGKSDWTTSNYRAKNSFFAKKIQFLKIQKGDGSVTWEGGIPKNLPNKNLYHTLTEHGQLANDPDLFSGIIDLLDNGRTSKFSKNPPVVRGVGSLVSHDMNFPVSNEEEEILHNLFGNTRTIQPVPEDITINVSVVHADLEFAKYPVLVGHFKNDGIVSAEGALNRDLGNKLMDRLEIGKYPEDINDNETIIMPGNNPEGGVVIGLGDNTELTGFRLSKTVELGVISYAMFLRDNFEEEEVYEMRKGISSLLIGSGYARLPLENSIQAILTGVDRANKLIKSINDLEPIVNLEFIELYEYKARNAYYSLKRIAGNESSLNLNVSSAIEQRNGAQKRLEYTHNQRWWDKLSTEQRNITHDGITIPNLLFNYSSGIARVEKASNFTSQDVINSLLKDFSPHAIWKKERAKTLFEILIPNDFKGIIRNQRNIIWKLDKVTAAYPWEMFHDYKVDAEPTFVNTGLIRQLITEEYRRKPKVIRNDSALVIGDPIYNNRNFSQLQGALNEAVYVDKILNQNEFKVNLLKRRESNTILDALYNNEYKVLHIAGHGVFDPEKRAVGPVLGNGIYLSPSLIESLPFVPEFAFINCCHSGETDGGYEKAHQDRYKLAANIGTALIELGVNAVVVAGWEVDDNAAEVFARTLYDRLMRGYKFGESVLMARKQCFNDFPDSSTWGAFQCYGDQFYKLMKKNSPSGDGRSYIASEEVEVDLYNLHIRVEGRRVKNKKKLLGWQEWLQDIMSRAYNHNVINGKILEMEANILASLEKFDEAVDKYRNLLRQNKADFSVRSLEQYCNLQVKILFDKIMHARKEADDAETELSDKQIRDFKKGIKGLLSDLRAVLMIGTTPERLSIIGFAFKRFALAFKEKESKAIYLKEMFDNYKMAYELTTHQSEEQLDALCNLLTAHALMAEKNKRSLSGEPIDAPTMLTKTMTELRTGIGIESEFDQSRSKVHLAICQLLNADEEFAPKLATQIKELYEETWSYGGNYHFVAAEIDHLEFLLEIKNGMIRTYIQDELQTIRTKLVSLIEEKLSQAM